MNKNKLLSTYFYYDNFSQIDLEELFLFNRRFDKKHSRVADIVFDRLLTAVFVRRYRRDKFIFRKIS